MRKKIIVLTILVFVLLPVFTHAVSWLPLVPCGVSNDNPDTPQDETKPCNQCDLFRLFKNIIDFVLIGLMPPAAAILFVWGGFLILMGGANPGWITQGKSIFWNTAIGVAIISSSWLITNSIIRSIAADNIAPEWWKFECRVTTSAEQPPISEPQPPASQPEPGPGQLPLPKPEPGQPPEPGEPPASQPATLVINTSSLSDARQDFNYSQTTQATGGKTPYNWSISGSAQLPSGLSINASTGEIFGKAITSGNFTFTVMVEDSSSPQKSATKQLSIKVVAPAASVIISSVISKNITNTSAVITWTTDKPSTSQVAYGTTTAYGTSTSLNSSLVTNHSVTVSGLMPGTTYNYQATSSITGFTARSSNYALKTTGQPPVPVPEPGQPVPQPPTNGMVVCSQSNLNLCQPQSTSCSASGCSQYVSSINQYAGRIRIPNGANLLKSIMIKESTCDARKVSFDGSSFGLMQFRPSTANIYKSRCGITVNIDSAWLTNPANANANICIAAEYLNALSQTSCGNTARGIAAGYNGGSGACNNSVDCANENSCAGGPKKRWECLYDNPAHTVCNGGNDPLAGYNETRNYATKVLYCYNNPGF